MKIFITGGTSGIGLELAKLYLEEGHDVAICGRDLTKIPASLCDKFEKLKTYELSVTSREDLEKAILDFSKDGLDLMIANAGRSLGSKIKIPNYQDSKDIIETNLFGVLNAFNPAIDLMVKQKKGHLVGVASVAGQIGVPGSSAYSASKAAVIKLCESLAIDLKSYGIAVTTICPGFIDTPLTRKNDHQMPFLMNAKEGAQKIKKAIEKKKLIYTFPLPMNLAIIFLKTIPRIFYHKLMSLKMFNYSRDQR